MAEAEETSLAFQQSFFFHCGILIRGLSVFQKGYFPLTLINVLGWSRAEIYLEVLLLKKAEVTSETKKQEEEEKMKRAVLVSVNVVDPQGGFSTGRT